VVLAIVAGGTQVAVRSLALSCLAWAAVGCVVPSLDSLGQKACDPDAGHLCADGYACIAGLCVAGGADGGPCTPGSVSALPCELQQGVCLGATRACVDGGWEAPCGAASYGPAWQASETRCDGLDNDCNGIVDRLHDGGALTSNLPCELDAGVCAGATRACVDGGWETPCGAASYGANWEGYETRCDGLDNDCDGLTDAWKLVNLSGSPTVRSFAPTLVPLPGSPSPGVAVFWTEGRTVTSRLFRRDGTLGPIQLPSTTLATAVGSGLPQLATDGVTAVAVWGEDVPTVDGGFAGRLMVATLGPFGTSNVSPDGGPGGAEQVPVQMSAGDQLALAIHGQTVLLGVAGEYGAGQLPSVELIGLPLPLPSLPSFDIFVAGGPGNLPIGRAIEVAALADGGFAAVWILSPNNLGATFLDAAGNSAPFALAGGTIAAPAVLAGANGGLPNSLIVDAQAVGTSIGSIACNSIGMCSGGSLTVSLLPAPPTDLSAVAPLGAPPAAVAWGDTSYRTWYFAPPGSGPPPGKPLGPTTFPTLRPELALQGPGPRNMIAVFDSNQFDAGVSATVGEVYAQPLCLP
jgi:hypothetical protein